ncbi:MAG: glycosyltransferase [Elusimicrobia bacterium]|nr:glycosyltransferase [Elusimicrobiota bacterium]
MRGGEKVLDALCELFPRTDLYTLLYRPGSVSTAIENRKIHTTFLQRFPGVCAYYRNLLPLMPAAIESFDLSSYDLVLSTSHCVAKGVLNRMRRAAQSRSNGKKPLHLCYCHTPMRYIWDQYDSYFAPGRMPWYKRSLMQALRPKLQKWDLESSETVDLFIANSKNTAGRIRRIYGREAGVIPPPVDLGFCLEQARPVDEKDYYLAVSALVVYKRMDLAVEAFNRLGKRLKIIGSGPQEKSLRKIAKRNIEFLGWVEAKDLGPYYLNCKALIFPGEEDFGIVPVEAMGAGKPVIAYRAGGLLESMVELRTGLFFDRRTPESLMEAVQKFEGMVWDAEFLRRHALQFDRSVFLSRFSRLLLETLKKYDRMAALEEPQRKHLEHYAAPEPSDLRFAI